MSYDNKFFKYGTAVLLVLLILFFLGKVDYLMTPIQAILFTIFLPLVFSGLFYYLFRPIVRIMDKWMPKVLAIIVLYVLLIGLLSGIVYFAGDSIAKQFNDLANSVPQDLEKVDKKTEDVVQENNFGLVSYEEVKNKAISYFAELARGIGNNIMGIVSMAASVATVMIVIPFILFYLLRDDYKLAPHVLNFIPKKHHEEGREILHDLDETLSTYIVGQVIVAMIVGVLTFIGFWIIGLKYGLLLAIFAMVMDIVPFLGPFIGIIPAVVVALMSSPMMLLKVVIVFIVVQQLEGNLITPQVMGKKLSLHPVTVILVIMAAGSVFGFFGILLAVPFYASAKEIVVNFRRFYKLRHAD
ncbi:AI-2E family transporter [Bacillus marinisedimentorum]|uniref:AI-2E family transporter n=1 Tax=Bacillus marinisedimentorum TaxID=1821260 RepID=UPI000872776F|nr:AI-2E family transporter [Bacillus marinisedimentorum]